MRRAINYVSFEVSTTATADDSLFLFKAERDAQLVILHLISLFPLPLPICENKSGGVTWVLDELEINQKKENHLNSICKMMGTYSSGPAIHF